MHSVKDLLTDAGFILTDDGQFWRSSAIYRGGNNKTSLRISKKDGYFVDFVTGQRGNLQKLLYLTTGEEISLDKYEFNIINSPLERPRIVQEKTWCESFLLKLLPHYKFYMDKGISKDTMQYFKGGLCHSGRMNERYTFAIYNEDGKIHGWSGRDIIGNKEAKWKHIGRKMNWVFPLYCKNNHGESLCDIAIKESGSVILVESIGDMLSLWDKGIRNVIVTFGLDLSSKIILALSKYNLNSIIIATNNDLDKSVNRGTLAAGKIGVKLLSFYDPHKIKIRLPINEKDFGDSSEEEIKEWHNNIENNDKDKTLDYMLDFLSAKHKNGKLTISDKKAYKFLKDLKK